MNPTTLVEMLERDSQFAGIRSYRGLPGLSRAFCDRVLELYVADQGGLDRLAPHAKKIVRYGDEPAYGYRALAIIERLRGRWMQSAQAFRAAGTASSNPRDRWAFQTGAVDTLARAGRIEEAESLAAELQQELEAIQEPALSARVALNLAYAQMQQDRYADARRTLSGIADRLAEANFAYEAASADLALSTCELIGGSLSDARAAAESAIRRADLAGADYVRDVAEGNLAYTEILRGEMDLGLRRLQPLVGRFEDAPVDRARTLEFIGDAYARMNLPREAIDLYQEALSIPIDVPALHRAHLQLGIGQAHLAADDPISARLFLRRAKVAYRRLGNGAWAALAEIALSQAEHRLSLPTAARRAQRAVDLARASGSRRHLVLSLINLAEIRNTNDGLAEAARIGRQLGMFGVSWRIEAIRARNAPQGQALRHYRTMFRAILADRTMTSSFASRTAFMRDKAAAIRAYLALLLAVPTPSRIREAISVVEQSRSVALLDELLGSTQEPIATEFRLHLAGLRERLEDSSSGEGGFRRKASVPADLNRIQRRWLDETHALIDAPLVRRQARQDTAVGVELDRSLMLLSQGYSTELAISPSQLETQLRWLHYDLIEPLTRIGVSEQSCLRSLTELARQLIPALREGVQGVCPDGVLWRVPWLALSRIANTKPVEVRLHPSMGARSSFVPEGLVVWFAAHEDLPASRREQANLERTFPAAKICRTLEEARVSLRSPSISALHVIAHASHRRENPMLSAIEFPEGALTAAEISRSPASIGVATLAACDTGLLSGASPAEPEGLVRAFLSRGAAYVVGSGWALDDEAGCRLYSRLYEEFRSGADLWSALSTAQGAVRQWNPHPYFWASPIVYGGYSA